jgi:tetratricopeptide (TPR) repeat protein
MLVEGMDLDETFSVQCQYAYWLLVAGRLSEALVAFDHIVELTGGDAQMGREILGFSPLLWAEHLAAWTLAQAGRFDECWPREERAIRMAREHSAQENLGWALGGSTTFSYLARGASRVPAADLRRIILDAEDLVDVVGGRYSEMYAAFSLAVGAFMSGDFALSEARFSEALAQACAAGNALEWQSYFLAVFADASLANGNVEAAIARAREAIAVADGSGAWFQSALARTALVDALIRSDSPETEIEALEAEARELVRKSGGNSLLPRLREAEARLAGRKNPADRAAGLREAESMYRAMGAPDPADRLAQELGERR